MKHSNLRPLLSIGVLSWNRLHYLRATLESMRRCIWYPRIQWMVIDNVSEEPGLAEYLKGLDWLDELFFLRSDHATAMNEIVSHAKGDVLLLWPDDVQFIVEGDWMEDCVDVLLRNEWIGSMGLNCLRRATVQRIWNGPIRQQLRPVLREFKRYGAHFRFPRKVYSRRGVPFQTYGWGEDGIIGAGIPSLTRMEVWRRMGPWKAPGSLGINDSSGGGETEMLRRWQNSGWALQRAIPGVPVAADIVNDPLGTKAKVRQNTRYGVYTPPPEGTFYYEILPQKELEARAEARWPIAFEDLVKPLGFELPLDADGNLLKSGINTSISQRIA